MNLKKFILAQGEINITEKITATELEIEMAEQEKKDAIIRATEANEKRILELQNQFKLEKDTRELNDAKDTLSSWLKKIIEFSQLEEVACSRLGASFKRILGEIEAKLNHFPEKFIHKDFIGYALKTSLMIWNHEAENMDDRYMCLSLPEEIKSEYAKIIKEIG